MSFADTGRAHQQQALFYGSWIVANKSLGQEFGFFQRVGLLRRGADVRAVTFKIAVFIAFGNVGALDDAFGAVLHAAVAGDGDFAGGSIGAWNELPAGAFAERAILERHADSIRLLRAYGKVWNVEIGESSGDGVAGFLNTEFAEATERVEKR